MKLLKLRAGDLDKPRFYIGFEKDKPVTGVRGRAPLFDDSQARKILSQLRELGFPDFEIVDTMEFPHKTAKKKKRPRGDLFSGG